MPAFENLDDFFQLDGYAVPVQVGPVGSAITIPAVFEAPHQEATDRNSMGSVSTTTPRLICKSADVAGKPSGTRVAVDGVQYVITDIQPDGTGISTVFLRKL